MEKTPTIRERLDNFEENKLKKQQEEFEKAVYGETAGISDFSDEAKMRLEEGLSYEEHLQKMSDRSEYNPLDILDHAKAVAEYQPEKEDAYQKQLAEQVEEEKHLNNQDDPRVERLMSYAQQINKLKLSQKEYVDSLSSKYQEAQKHGLAVDFISYINSDPHYQSIQKDLLKKENYLNDQLLEWSEQDSQVFTDQIINEIIDATDHEAYLRTIANWQVAQKADNADDAEGEYPIELMKHEFADNHDVSDGKDAESAETYQINDNLDNLTEDQIDQALEEVNNPNASPAKQQSWYEKLAQSKWLKKVIALVAAGFLAANLTGSTKFNDEADESIILSNQPNANETIEALPSADANFELANSVNTYEEFLASDEYLRHQPGDAIEFSSELEKQINERRTGNYSIFAPIQGETLNHKVEFIKKAAFYSPELIASLEMVDLPGFQLQYIDLDGKTTDALSHDEINQAVEQMKSDPQLFGANYDRFLAAIQDASLNTMHVEAGQMNAYKYMNRETMRFEMAIGSTSSEGNAVVFEMTGGVRLVIMEHCANVLIYTLKDVNTTLVVEIEKGDETPENPQDPEKPQKTEEEKTPDKPESIPKDPETPHNTPPQDPQNPQTPPQPVAPPKTPPVPPSIPPAPHPEQKLEPKDFDKLPDANDAVKSDGKSSGNNLQQAGDLKDEVRSTKETVEQQIIEQQTGSDEVDRVTERQADQNLQVEAAQIQESLQQLNTESDSVIMSENPSAETAINQTYEQVQQQAGEAQDGINQTIEIVKPEEKITDATIFDKIDELQQQGFSEDDMSISKDADGNYKIEVDANQGKVELP